MPVCQVFCARMFHWLCGALKVWLWLKLCLCCVVIVPPVLFIPVFFFFFFVFCRLCTLERGFTFGLDFLECLLTVFGFYFFHLPHHLPTAPHQDKLHCTIVDCGTINHCYPCCSAIASPTCWVLLLRERLQHSTFLDAQWPSIFGPERWWEDWDFRNT